MKEIQTTDYIAAHINKDTILNKRENDNMNTKMTDDMMSKIGIGFYELISDYDENDNLTYIAGHMLNRANADQRIKESNELKTMGYKTWNPIEDKSINDKQNVDKETNNQLSKRIVLNDTTGILKSKKIVIEPEVFALGTIAEAGQIFAYKHVGRMIKEIIKHNENNTNGLLSDLNILMNMCEKDVYPHIDDIRIPGVEESGYNKSWSVNQYLRGICQGISNTEDGFYSWENVLEMLKKEIYPNEK